MREAILVVLGVFGLSTDFFFSARACMHIGFSLASEGYPSMIKFVDS